MIAAVAGSRYKPKTFVSLLSTEQPRCVAHYSQDDKVTLCGRTISIMWVEVKEPYRICAQCTKEDR
jgi:hypothetical protein